MKKYGIIMEINPFHNGHIHFLSEVKKIAKNNPIICIISTNYVQRGELTILNKETKINLLLNNNVDLVLELPMIYANQGGEYFAYHAINILNEFKITDIIFGSESNDLNAIKEFIKLDNNNTSFKEGLHSNLNTLKSNDILGVSYLKAITKINPSINAHTIKRINNNYNDNELNGSISSATSIRMSLDDKKILNYLPNESYENILTLNNELLFTIFKNNLEISLSKNLNIFLSENGQLLKKINKTLIKNKITSINDLANKCADKNNSKYKINRIIINTCLLITDDEINIKDKYLRVIGINKSSFNLLKETKGYFTSLNDINNSISNIEKRAINLFNMVSNDNFNDYNKKPIIKE